MIKRLLLIAAITLTALGNTGCTTTEVRYVPVQQPLPLPPRPILPAVTAQEMECINKDAIARLIERQRLRRQYAEELELIIRSTHGSDPDGR